MYTSFTLLKFQSVFRAKRTKKSSKHKCINKIKAHTQIFRLFSKKKNKPKHIFFE